MFCDPNSRKGWFKMGDWPNGLTAFVPFISQIDWRATFVPTIHLGEVFLRGSIVYLFLLFILRILRRQAGTIGISDLLVIVLIADAAQNAMSSDYKSIPEGLVLVATIVCWDYCLDWLSYKFPKVRRLIRPVPLLLIKDGRINRRRLKKEMITEEELMTQLREQGIESAEEVKLSYLEGDGHLSVVKKRDEQPEAKKKEIRS
jgi:uncharacterized membrane protein YcaP (DUF421 family)